MLNFYRAGFFLLLPVVLIVTFLLLQQAKTIAGDDEALVLNRGQAETMLTELQSIRKLLQKIEQQGLAKAPPAKPKAPVTARLPMGAPRPFLGAEDAPVTVVEFTDYQCPFCRRFVSSTFPLLKRDFIDTGKVRWEVRDLPLGFHQQARGAAQAARCASEQDKFWKMRDSLFRNNANLDAPSLLVYADELGLDMKAFKVCVDSGRYLDEIDADSRLASQSRITGTPTFVIGKTQAGSLDGSLVVGAQSPAVFAARIEALLSQNP